MVHLSVTAQDIFNTIAQYQYAVIIPLTALEGPVVVFLTGFLVSVGLLNPYIAYGMVVAGNIAGDFIYYAIGKWGRGPLKKGWGRAVGITPKNSEEMKRYFSKHSARTLVVGILTHVFGAATLIAAGMVDFPLWRLFVLGLVAGAPKMAALMVLGYFNGQIYQSLGIYFTILTVASIAFVPLSFWLFSLSDKIKEFLERK